MITFVYYILHGELFLPPLQLFFKAQGMTFLHDTEKLKQSRGWAWLFCSSTLHSKVSFEDMKYIIIPLDFLRDHVL